MWRYSGGLGDDIACRDFFSRMLKELSWAKASARGGEFGGGGARPDSLAQIYAAVGCLVGGALRATTRQLENTQRQRCHLEEDLSATAKRGT